MTLHVYELIRIKDISNIGNIFLLFTKNAMCIFLSASKLNTSCHLPHCPVYDKVHNYDVYNFYELNVL